MPFTPARRPDSRAACAARRAVTAILHPHRPLSFSVPGLCNMCLLHAASLCRCAPPNTHNQTVPTRGRKADRPPAATKGSEDFAHRRACGKQPPNTRAHHKLGETRHLCYKLHADVEICDGLRNLRSAACHRADRMIAHRPRRKPDDDFLSSDDLTHFPAAWCGGLLDCS